MSDINKLRIDLVPPEGIEGAAAAFQEGLARHGERDWEKNGCHWGSVFGGLMRHAWAWWRGEEFDSDGKHNLDGAIACAMMLKAMSVRRIGTDTRKPQ